MTPCIEWTGAKSWNGYGLIRRGGKNHRVHRYVWANANGPIPAGLVVCHRCDNPPCYNLQHLFIGTLKDNSVDMVRKGRSRYGGQTHCAYGHPFAGDNLGHGVRPTHRRCKKCDARRSAEYRERKRAREVVPAA